MSENGVYPKASWNSSVIYVSLWIKALNFCGLSFQYSHGWSNKGWERYYIFPIANCRKITTGILKVSKLSLGTKLKKKKEKREKSVTYFIQDYRCSKWDNFLIGFCKKQFLFNFFPWKCWLLPLKKAKDLAWAGMFSDVSFHPSGILSSLNNCGCRLTG